MLKQIPCGDLAPDETVDAMHEAKLLSKLDNTGIVKFHDSFVDGEFFCIVTEFCEVRATSMLNTLWAVILKYIAILLLTLGIPSPVFVKQAYFQRVASFVTQIDDNESSNPNMIGGFGALHSSIFINRVFPALPSCFGCVTL